MKFNVLEKIDSNEVIHVSLTPIDDAPHIFIVTNKENITQSLTNGFEIFNCNEILKSLNVCPDECIEFKNYAQYADVVDLINRLLEYKRIMEKLTQKTYDEIGISAYQVYNVVLNRLLKKHDMKKSEYFTAVVKRALEDWIAEALPYFK